jgi:transposase
MPSTFYKIRACRQRAMLLPPRIDDYIAADNPARAIEAYVDTVDLIRLGFRHAERVIGAGQPPYDPADLLKLYLYGYLNQIRSSRRLEREAGRNIELMWLLGNLVPGYRTVAKFRAENAAPLRQVNRDFVLILRKLGLVGGAMVAIDGAFFDANASRASIVTRDRLAAQMAKLDGKIAAVASEIAAAESEAAAYVAALDANDAAETDAAQADAAQADVAQADVAQADVAQADTVTPDAASRQAALLARRAAVAADVAQLEASGETQLSRTDPDARLLSKTGQSVSGYNVQIAVDAAHKLIVAAEAVSDGNDTGQLHVMAQAARAAMGADKLRALADVGYYNGEALKACEADGIEAFVPEPDRGKRLDREGRFALDAFAYDAAADVYRCPAGQLLTAMRGGRTDASGKLRIKYASRRSVCRGCGLRSKCLSAKGRRRVIERWEHEAVIERHRARMAGADEVMRHRKELAEHPFGTLKCRAGYRHFLVRGLAKVRGELGLMVLCYNFTRVLNIVGLEKLIAWLAAASLWLEIWLLRGVPAPLGRFLAGFYRWGAKTLAPAGHRIGCHTTH